MVPEEGTLNIYRTNTLKKRTGGGASHTIYRIVRRYACIRKKASHAHRASTEKFFRRVNQYASVYRLGATGVVAESAVKWYHSHRGALQRELDVAKAEWEKKVRLGAI
ncbi:hypothetical protein B0H19DRAFT_1080855 [Mycena capillaripes]|nr:hypothetical protein B0H19DRAFT_1080855 [Mycena capillaripes]